MLKGKMILFLLFGIGFLFISGLQFKYDRMYEALMSLLFAAVDFVAVYLFYKKMPKG